MAQLRMVDGFLFQDEEEYKAALKEQKAILYLRQQISGKNAQEILRIYSQLLEQKLFHTEVGYAFLHDIYVSLSHQKSINNSDIPIIKIEKKEPVVIEKEVKPKRHKATSSSQVKALKIMVVSLLVVVIAMFAITLTSTNPTILDYETKLQNKYASWEQQLTEREAQVAAREAALNGN